MNDIDLIKSKLNDFKCTDSYVFSAIENIELQLKLLGKLQETLYSAELYLIYKHTSPDGKVYIGITKNLPNARWNEGAGYETQKKFYKAIQTFGWINFKHEIIAAGLSEKEAKKLESELILANKSNEDEFGYNTQVLHTIKEETVKKDEKKEKNSANNTEVASKLIEEFSIKTIGGTIYYMKDGEYIKEKENPIIRKELLLKYHIEARKQKEVIEQIKILSYSKKIDIFPAVIKETIDKSIRPDIPAFFRKLMFERYTGYFISDEVLYEEYISWANQWNLDIIEEEEFFKKTPTWIKKYRKDVERVVTTYVTGWKLNTGIGKVSGDKFLTPTSMEQLVNWLDNTNNNIICVPMICEKVFGIQSKGSRKIGNEICFALRNVIPGWKEIGVQRTKEYGNQLCFGRK